MLITKAWLEARGACSDQVAIFDAEWPDGVEVSLEALLRAARLGLNLDWLAGHVLKGALWVEYKRQAAPLWAELDCQMVLFREESKRRVAPLRAEYERKADSFMVEFYRQAAPFIAEFYRQVAPILWELIQSQEE